MKKRSILSILLCISLVLVTCTTGIFAGGMEVYAEDEDVYQLKVFETSDIHGYISEIYNDEREYRLSYISDKVKDVRGYGDAYRKDKAVLIDTGDLYQGNVMSNINKGSAISAAMNAMDYDAVGIGNHEFDWLLETVIDEDKTMRDYSIGNMAGPNYTPVTCCNLYQNDEKYPRCNDYVILDKVATDSKGKEIKVKIGVIGFADDYSSIISYNLFNGLGYEIKKDFSVVNGLAKELEESGKCDATILLYHGEAKEAANALGGETKVDLVMGGHTHKVARGETEAGVKYVQPSCNAQCYIDSTFGFTYENGEVKFTDVLFYSYNWTTDNREQMHKLPENMEYLDPTLLDITDIAVQESETVLNREVGYITESVLRNDYFPNTDNRSNTAGNWVTSIIRRAGNADVAMINSGGLRKDIVVTGDKRTITEGDIYEQFPFEEDMIYVYQITFEDLLEVMEYSMIPKAGRGLFSRMSGIKCYFDDRKVNALQLLDGNVVYINGKWKGDWKERELKMAVPSFIATTERSAEGYSNPLINWNETDKLVSKDMMLQEKAFEVLRNEAGVNDGYLYVDTVPYFTCDDISDPHWYLSADGDLTIEKELTEIPEDMFKDYSDQKEVYYEGTSDEWYAMNIEEKWLIESDDVYIVCTDKTIVASSYKDKGGGDTPTPDPKPDPKPTPVPEYSNEWVDGKWYNEDGSQTYSYTGSWKCNDKGWWFEDTGKWYPYECWQRIDGKWYYFDADGYMAESEWIDGYWLSANGAWEYEGVGSWHVNSKGWWFEDTLGWYAHAQWQKINGKWYYFGEDGYMLTNCYVGDWWVNADGAWE